MNGEFYSDITLDGFRQYRHFSRVIMQQGRVQLDRDFNEQIDILLHYLRTFIADVVGPHGSSDNGFRVEKYQRAEQAQEAGKGRRTRQKAAETTQLTDVPFHFLIDHGHYYVNGILTENDREYVYSIPPALRPATSQSSGTHGGSANDDSQVSYFLYLDVWEREVSYLEDALIREVALGGPDTTTRSQVVWKVRAVKPEDTGSNPPDPKDYTKDGNFDLPNFAADWTTHLQTWKTVDHGHLQAQTVDVEQSSKEPCVVSPTSQYRGMENQLYRVEIRDGIDNPDGTANPNGPTFKWSRENGAVMFPIIGPVASGDGQESLTLSLGNLGRDDSRFGLNVDDWVEIVAIENESEGEPGPLMRVQQVQYASRQVTLVSESEQGVTVPERALFLRRWDYQVGDPSDKRTPKIAASGALQIQVGVWLSLENGIQIQFSDKTATYKTGDYWLIPARTATGTIEWPRHNNQPDSLPPHGVKHYFAPLAYKTLKGGKVQDNASYDLRHIFKTL